MAATLEAVVDPETFLDPVHLQARKVLPPSAACTMKPEPKLTKEIMEITCGKCLESVIEQLRP